MKKNHWKRKRDFNYLDWIIPNRCSIGEATIAPSLGQLSKLH